MTWGALVLAPMTLNDDHRVGPSTSFHGCLLAKYTRTADHRKCSELQFIQLDGKPAKTHFLKRSYGSHALFATQNSQGHKSWTPFLGVWLLLSVTILWFIGNTAFLDDGFPNYFNFLLKDRDLWKLFKFLCWWDLEKAGRVAHLWDILFWASRRGFIVHLCIA